MFVFVVGFVIFILQDIIISPKILIYIFYSEKGRSLSRAFIVFAGCEPLEFKNLFPWWEESEDITQRQLEAGRKQGEKQKLNVVLSQLEK